MAFGIVLPCIDEEAVQAAENSKEERRRKQGEAQFGLAGDGGDEDSGGEEDADGDLFGEAVSAAGGMDQDEVAEDQAAEDEIEMDCVWRESKQERGEGHGGQ